jgi:hypothetical protein
MTRVWNFRDYVNSHGENEIHAWLNSLPKRAKARINALIRHLEAVKLFSTNDAKVLHGSCDGLFELRIFVERVQYRPLCSYGPNNRDITILFGAIEKGDKFVPATACSRALDRKAEIFVKERTCEHDFS